MSIKPFFWRLWSVLPVVGLSSGGNVEAAPNAYVETFNNGHGGWIADRCSALPVWDGVAYCHGPWWTDANHAPPGAGYLHIVMWTYTDKKHYQKDTDNALAAKLGVPPIPYRYSRFAEEGWSKNLTGAKLTVRLRGEVDLKGAQLVFHVQAKTDKTTANFALTGRPFTITHDWSEQTVTLTPDPKQWTCLGARHDMQNDYGCDDIAKVLADVNLDMTFLLFPVKVVPASRDITEKDIHVLRAVKDYPVDPQQQPKGLIMFDTIKIEYPNGTD